jgi:hypothetical protein
MGSNETGGNQSVHWKITMDDSPSGEAAVTGRDDLGGKGFASIGSGSQGKKPHTGHFEVSLRFDDVEAAKKGLEAALASIASYGNYALAKVRVRAINRTNPDNDPPAEVRIDW